MELAVFITKHTDAAIAEMLNVSVRTVAAWRRLERSPSPMQSMDIIEKSGGAVNWQGIYQPYVRYRLRSGRYTNSTF